MALGTDISAQGFPQLTAPVADSSGRLTTPWYRFMLTMWERTGGSNSSSILGTYTGEIRAYAVSSIPSGWLVCDGSAVSRSTYSNLFAILGITWGAGDGNTTFNLPDLRFRTMVGVDNSHAPGVTGGASSATLNVGNLPSHNHGITDPGHVHSVVDPSHSHTITDPTHAHASVVAASNVTAGAAAGGVVVGNTANAATGITATNVAPTGISLGTAVTGITTNTTGSGGSFSTMPPFGVVTLMIKT